MRPTRFHPPPQVTRLDIFKLYQRELSEVVDELQKKAISIKTLHEQLEKLAQIKNYCHERPYYQKLESLAIQLERRARELLAARRKILFNITDNPTKQDTPHLLHIFQFCSIAELMSGRQACKSWYNYFTLLKITADTVFLPKQQIVLDLTSVPKPIPLSHLTKSIKLSLDITYRNFWKSKAEKLEEVNVLLRSRTLSN